MIAGVPLAGQTDEAAWGSRELALGAVAFRGRQVPVRIEDGAFGAAGHDGLPPSIAVFVPDAADDWVRGLVAGQSRVDFLWPIYCRVRETARTPAGAALVATAATSRDSRGGVHLRPVAVVDGKLLLPPPLPPAPVLTLAAEPVARPFTPRPLADRFGDPPVFQPGGLPSASRAGSLGGYPQGPTAAQLEAQRRADYETQREMDRFRRQNDARMKARGG